MVITVAAGPAATRVAQSLAVPATDVVLTSRPFSSNRAAPASVASTSPSPSEPVASNVVARPRSAAARIAEQGTVAVSSEGRYGANNAVLDVAG